MIIYPTRGVILRSQDSPRVRKWTRGSDKKGSIKIQIISNKITKIEILKNSIQRIRAYRCARMIGLGLNPPKNLVDSLVRLATTPEAPVWAKRAWDLFNDRYVHAR